MRSAEDGIHALARAEYDAIDREHFSVLSAMAQSPAHYRHARANPRDASDPLRLGIAAHMAVLEPHELGRFHVWEKRRQGGDWETFRDTHGEDNVLTAAQWTNAIAIGKAVRSHPDAAPLLIKGHAEASVLWTHREPAIAGVAGFEVQMKARLDWLGRDCIVDVKTTRDASPDAFGRAAFSYRMHTQMALYRAGVQAVTGRLLPVFVIAVENVEPFVTQVYAVPEPLLERGRREFKDWLQGLVTCREHDVWPGYATGAVELTLPKWAKDPTEEAAHGW